MAERENRVKQRGEERSGVIRKVLHRLEVGLPDDLPRATPSAGSSLLPRVLCIPVQSRAKQRPGGQWGSRRNLRDSREIERGN